MLKNQANCINEQEKSQDDSMVEDSLLIGLNQ